MTLDLEDLYMDDAYPNPDPMLAALIRTGSRKTTARTTRMEDIMLDILLVVAAVVLVMCGIFAMIQGGFFWGVFLIGLGLLVALMSSDYF